MLNYTRIEYKIESLFVPFDIAVSVFQLGFNEPCLTYYEAGHLSHDFFVIEHAGRDNHIVPAPTISQCLKFFRDKCLSDLSVSRYQDRTDGSIWYAYYIMNEYGINEVKHHKDGFYSYEEAELAGIKKMIEICKK